jgi:Xaa-Pro dipeptidase
MPQDYERRIDKLLAIGGVDAIAIVPGTNMAYFTGLDVHLSERPIVALFAAGGLSLIIPQLEAQKVTSRADLEAQLFVWTDEEGCQGAFARALDGLGLRGKTLGIDGMTMRVTEWLTFSQIDPSLKVHPVERELMRIRAHKMPDEVAAMRRAIAISEAALRQLLTEVHPGMSEKAIAARLEALMIQDGGDGLAFGTLVQSGPNSANPHGSTTDRVLQDNEYLLIDYGCTVDGYPADITRTFCFGRPSAEMQKIYDTVLRANEAAKAVVKPGLPCELVDKAARGVIEAAGYGQYFFHRTGHGLGLDVHEPVPQIASGVEYPLEPGMTFTIEPGIYVSGLGGVRIEDNILVTDTGAEVLTSFPRSLVASA